MIGSLVPMRSGGEKGACDLYTACDLCGGPYTAVIDPSTHHCGGRGLNDGVIMNGLIGSATRDLFDSAYRSELCSADAVLKTLDVGTVRVLEVNRDLDCG